jgi:hypothetical protein
VTNAAERELSLRLPWLVWAPTAEDQNESVAFPRTGPDGRVPSVVVDREDVKRVQVGVTWDTGKRPAPTLHVTAHLTFGPWGKITWRWDGNGLYRGRHVERRRR